MLGGLYFEMCVIAIGEGFSRINVLSRGPPLSLFDICFSQ
jgi:hypothetical protein